MDDEDIDDKSIFNDADGKAPESISMLEAMDDPKQFIYMTITNKKENGKTFLLDFSVLIEPKKHKSISSGT